MKIQLLRGGALAKEVEFTANLPPLEINRLAVDLMFENFERNETYLWPNEEDMRGARHEVQVIADNGDVLKTINVREIAKEAGLGFLGRRPATTS
jgi:hypothetical protein